ncbi:Transthyretin-like family protein, partial [Oesophagostomum dentatum]
MKLLVFVPLIGLTLALRQQSIRVKGRLVCGPTAASNVRVKLWEEDEGPDSDDLLAASYTDVNGMFDLSGGTTETTNIDPVLKVYHNCDDGAKPGMRKVKFYLPKSYITEGPRPQKVFDIGTVNLLLVFVSLIGLTLALRQQSIRVKGKLVCGPKAASNVRVKLWEEDEGPDPDDLLAAGYTDVNGMFDLSGGTTELTAIDPVFKVYHDCDDAVKVGLRKAKFYLPKSYI